MILLAIIGLIALYFLLGIRGHTQDGANAMSHVARELERMNELAERESAARAHRAAHERGRKG